MNVKGSALRARVQYVEERGEGAYARLLDSLSPTARGLVEEGFLPNQWYPFDVFCELCEVIDRQHGSGDLSLCFDLGRYACDANLPTLYRLFFKVGNIGYIIGKAEVAWRTTYDFGAIKKVGRTDRSVTLRIEDVPEPRRAHCLSILGWCVRAGEISGARNTRWTERCRAVGDMVCEMHLEWD